MSPDLPEKGGEFYNHPVVTLFLFRPSFFLVCILKVFIFQDSSKKKTVQLVVSIAGIKVCSPDGKVSFKCETFITVILIIEL